MSIEGYTIRNAQRHEVDLIISWADQEGWNPGLNDAEAFYGTDPNGFFLGVMDGLPVASISAVAYNDSFGFLGFYIVKPSLRGKGLGTEVWNAGMKYLGDRNIGLDSVLSQQKLYEHLGFQPYYRSVRHQGVGTGKKSNMAGIKSLSDVPIKDLLAYDDRFFPVPRHAFTSLWIGQQGAVALAAMDGSRLDGYGLLRICHTGYKIGPLFADDEDVAESLFGALCGQAPPGAPVFLDTPAVSPAALDLARRHHMNPVFETIRMYTRGDPHLPMDQIYGVTSFELG